jgi:SAF domain
MKEEPIHYNLWKNGALTQAMSLILQACMRGKFNILVSADEDAGRAELVQSLCACIGRDESNIEGIIGGCSSLDYAKLLQVMNNRCPGSILTVCAESPVKGLLQLEARVREADSSLSRRAAKELICSSIEVVIQTARMRDGTWFAVTDPSWRITDLSELIWVSDSEEHWHEGYERGEGYYGLSSMYFFDGETGAYVGSGLPPKFFDRLELARIPFMFSWLAGPATPVKVGSLYKEEAQRRFENPIQVPKEPQMSVAFAKRAIKAGQIISSADFEIRSVGVSQAPPARDLYLAVEGTRAKVDVNIGVPIKRSDIDSSCSTENQST